MLMKRQFNLKRILIISNQKARSRIAFKPVQLNPRKC